MTRPCRQCPFRRLSGYTYDADAHEALNDGCTPACHMVVGADQIFAHEPLSPPAECRGHTAWLNGEPGYRKPL